MNQKHIIIILLLLMATCGIAVADSSNPSCNVVGCNGTCNIMLDQSTGAWMLFAYNDEQATISLSTDASTWDTILFTDSNQNDAIGYLTNSTNMPHERNGGAWDDETFVYHILNRSAAGYTIIFVGADGQICIVPNKLSPEHPDIIDRREDGRHSWIDQYDNHRCTIPLSELDKYPDAPLLTDTGPKTPFGKRVYSIPSQLEKSYNYILGGLKYVL